MVDSWISLIVILVLGYFVLYFIGRKYLERFENVSPPNTSHTIPEKPYLTQPINDIDDYEISSVFHNTGSRVTSKKDISDAMSQYPLDWSVQGQNSQQFQEGQAEFKRTMQPISGFDGNSASIINDTMSQDEEEKKILQTYVPESSKGLLEYSIDDVTQLLTKLYDRKGLIPVIKKSQQGENAWEIVEVKEKNPKIVWEDELPREIKQERGEDVIRVPYTVSDVASGMDPFFQSNPSTRMGRDYTSFTPGLERMFAPTQPVRSWF